MGFTHPELLLVLVPAAVAWFLARGPVRATAVVRALVIVLLVAALAGPYLLTAQTGRDLVIVVDRSRSMPEGAREAALEMIRLAAGERREGDRIAVVSFGERPQVEQLPAANPSFAHFERDVGLDGSDIDQALETALELVPADRQGSILLLSDGEANGRDPVGQARRAFARGVRIDVRPIERAATNDVSIERIDLPEGASVLEPFQFSVWVRADRRVESEFALERGGKVLSSGRRVFEPGMNRIVLRDVVDSAGVAQYRVRISAGEDRVPENDAAIGALAVDGPRSILVVNDDGRDDVLVNVLRAARIPVKVSTPESAALTAVALTAHRGIIVENVAAERFGTRLPALAAFVRDGGGGLLVTGGRSSFGTGGWFKSALDPVLPVSMEMRQEHRKQSIALSITMDRSGSMAVPVGGGMTKMDLANLGALAAIELLSPMDSISVIAVDSSAHVIQPQTQVEDVAELVARVRKIHSEGGGIFTYTALLAAAEQLRGATQATRHIILFADAADAEEPGEYIALLAELAKAGVSVSVIALGTDRDSDAAFLKDVAARGSGEIYFTTDPAELPRLFAQDTLTVSRATFIEEPTACEATPNLFGLTEVVSKEFTDIDGYNLTYLRPGAVAGVVTRDDYQAPVLAFHQHGLGRSAAFTGQIGGTTGRTLVAWPGFSNFFVSVARWVIGQEEPGDVFASVRRDGSSQVISVEIDPEAATRIDASRLSVRIRAPDGTARDVALERTGDNRFEARTALAREGVQLGTIGFADGRTLELPPLALPYSPEFERGSDAERGDRLLRSLARESAGIVNPSASDLFSGDRASRGWRPLSRALVLAALILVLVEIAARRLELWSFVRVPAFVGRSVATVRARLRAPTRAAKQPVAPPVGSPTAPPSTTPATSETEPEKPAQAPSPTIESALDKARRAAGRRLER
jgi:uncharacterized membrane protein